jgi:hypothetical protein
MSIIKSPSGSDDGLELVSSENKLKLIALVGWLSGLDVILEYKIGCSGCYGISRTVSSRATGARTEVELELMTLTIESMGQYRA